ncbi:acyltransferase [Amycolatopsis vastitatis]|uniref:N-acetyltransferase n=1 Tax=Amycolatopsis vastitatis TaxID=1905142 RepID=A0A229SMH0_9PSEU|nr:acyltransferase [Amycolatopsis vastitatis]OXM60010.1 N-acetyltransferase [Amycolatopsis vastitatis]
MITDTEPFVEASADVGPGARIGAGTRVWHQAQVADGVEIGTGCTLGKSCYIGSGSRIGDNVKIGNHADVFGAQLDDDVMISPQVVLTEDRTPRATRPDGQRQGPGDWTSAPVIVRRGATVGAGARVAPGIEIGPYALVGIGAVVLRDVAAHALVLGNPARAVGWVCRCAGTLDDRLRCPRCERTYELAADLLTKIQVGR